MVSMEYSHENNMGYFQKKSRQHLQSASVMRDYSTCILSVSESNPEKYICKNVDQVYHDLERDYEQKTHNQKFLGEEHNDPCQET